MYKPTLILLCGLPGSGKTTLAKKLEVTRQAIRLCPDEWMDQLGISLFDGVFRGRLEKILWQHAQKHLQSGQNVILENGLWSKQERLDKKRETAGLDISIEIHVFDVPLVELKRRIMLRNQVKAIGICEITDEQMEEYWKSFQRPTKQELNMFDKAVMHGVNN